MPPFNALADNSKTPSKFCVQNHIPAVNYFTDKTAAACDNWVVGRVGARVSITFLAFPAPPSSPSIPALSTEGTGARPISPGLAHFFLISDFLFGYALEVWVNLAQRVATARTNSLIGTSPA